MHIRLYREIYLTVVSLCLACVLSCYPSSRPCQHPEQLSVCARLSAPGTVSAICESARSCSISRLFTTMTSGVASILRRAQGRTPSQGPLLHPGDDHSADSTRRWVVFGLCVTVGLARCVHVCTALI